MTDERRTDGGGEIERLGEATRTLRSALGEIVVGQRAPIDEILAALLAGGHVLLEGVPGVAKTLIARALAAALGLEFRRVQFTPDLMPADVTGTNVFDFNRSEFQLQRGPVFTQVLLADEINRTPPKTQAALLEAMAERQVTIDGTSYPLADPFFVIATQNPLEHEGTYPLPEAQLDRFLMKIVVGYPGEDEEVEIYRHFLDGRLDLAAQSTPLRTALPADALPGLRRALGSVVVDDKVLHYVRELVSSTRRSHHLAYGASPRAGMALIACARAWAAMEGRDFVIPDDVKRLAEPVLRHRLLPTAEAELEGRSAGDVLAALLEGIEVPR
jgi:MoxR-like ATPase